METPTNRYTPFTPVLLPGSNRSINASSAERSLLLGVIASNLSILDARDNDSRTLRHKSLLWDQVTKKFNSLSALPRSRHQIQTLYKNMKAKAKKYQMRLMEAKIENAPHAIPEPDPVSELLLQLLAGENEQRRIYLQQTALNISGELSLALSNGEDEQQMSQPNCSISPTVSFEPEEYNPDPRLKEEPSSSGGQTSLETCLLGEETSVLRAPEDNTFATFSDGKDDYVQSNSIMEQSDDNRDNSAEQFNEPANKRPCLSPYDHDGKDQQKTEDLTKNAYQFIQNFSENLNPLQFTDAHNPSAFPGSRQCCCPILHSELIAMAKKEHILRLSIVEDEKRQRAEEHTERLKLLKLEQEVLRQRLRDKVIENGVKGSQASNDSMSLALHELEAICSNNSISMKRRGECE